MKKCFLYLAGLLVLLAYSCADEQLVEQTGNKLRITGSLAPDSRTSFVQGDGVIETHWNVGDEIALYADAESEPLYNAQNNLKYKATISGKTTEFQQGGEIELKNVEGKIVYAYYPFNFPYEGYSKEHTIPSTSWLNGSTLGTPFLYAQGQIRNNQLNFSFKHYFAYLKIRISVQEIREIFADYLKQGWYGIGQESDYDLTKTYLEINSTEDIAHEQGSINPRTQEITYKRTGKTIILILDDIDYSSEKTYSYMVPILPQSAGTNVTASIRFVKHGERYGSGTTFDKKTVPENGFKAGNVYKWKVIDKVTNEELAALLKTFYEKTNGPYWRSQTNWLSDKPVEEWSGVYLNPNGKLSSLWLESNNLVGQFPDEIAEMMNKSDGELSLNFNQLYGEIPQKIKTNSRWPTWGWNMVAQMAYGEPVVQDYNLFAPDVQVENLFEEESAENGLYEIFRKNKLIQIIKGYDNNSYKPNSIFIKNELNASRINLHLDYQNKGLATVVFVGDVTDEELQNFKNDIVSVYGNVDDIYWCRGISPIRYHRYSGSYIFDSNGQLVYYAYYNISGANSDIGMQNINKMSHNNFTKMLRDVLGEPAEHPDFTPGLYTSTDYSRDGEVVTLQSATVGSGITLIFLGDGFVDKDMEPDGYYEEFMKKAMENLFSEEPYKTFRNRFNVYTVKVVSPNAEWVEGAQHVLNVATYWDYAIKVPSKHPMMTTVFLNPKHGILNQDRSHCRWYDDGEFVSFITGADPNGRVLLHETGGHGFARLRDEYVESGYESKTLPDKERVALDNEWAQYGRGANVDWRNDENTVKWSHFLKDSRYDNEGLGIYEGSVLYGYGAYRPTENSIMRHHMMGDPFNAPSREQIYKRIMQLSEGEDWTYDYEKFVEYDAINRKLATRAPVRTLTDAERREYAKNHQPPIVMKGTWRDAIKNKGIRVRVPLRH